MLHRSSLLAALFVLVSVLVQESRCHNSYQPRSSYPEDTLHELMRRSRLAEEEDEDSSSTFPKMESDIFGARSDDSSDHSRMREENDSSLSADEASVLDLPLGRISQPMKRRKGPTLSVVNPLEILRQRLMLDLARRKIHENQQQIVANAQFLENIGKRSSPSVSLRQRSTDVRDNNYQP